MGLPPQFVYDENAKLRAEIERLKEELAISEQAVGVSEWRRQECLRLQGYKEAWEGCCMDRDRAVEIIEQLKKELEAQYDHNADLDRELDRLTSKDKP